jgi:hypothetical protein
VGLSLAVIAMLLLLLPGAAFVFSYHRDNSHVRRSHLDAQISEVLALAVLVSLGLNALWFWACDCICQGLDWVRPDVSGFLSVLRGEPGDPSVATALISAANYPLRVAAYFGCLALTGYVAGPFVRMLRSGARPTYGGALWGPMLAPSGHRVVVLSAEVATGDGVSTVSGLLHDYAVDRDGGLKRVVLTNVARRTKCAAHPMRKRIRGARRGQPSPQCAEAGSDLVVLNVVDTKAINIRYVVG